MRRKSSKQLFSVLMAATMVMSGISIPVNASQVDDAVVRSVLTKTEAEASESREINFNEGWKFHYGDVENAEKKDFDDSDLAKWGNLKLPIVLCNSGYHTKYISGHRRNRNIVCDGCDCTRCIVSNSLK